MSTGVGPAGRSGAVGEVEVVVVGAGPTGLMLAAELAIAGVDVLVLERRSDQHVDSARAGGLLPRSLEVLDQRGVVDRFLDAGHTVPAHGFAGIPLDVSDLPTRHNHVLALPQSEFEPLLADWVLGELGVPAWRCAEVAGLVQDDDGAQVALADGRSVRASYVVGCDGGRSFIRDAAGIAFVGEDPSRSWIIAELDATDDPPLGAHYTATGLHGISRDAASGRLRVVLTEASVGRGTPTVDELRAALTAVHGSDLGCHSVHWISRFTDATRLAVSYRDRRVLLAGDAAHIHPPHGGQGLNTGLQDAVNLGWKLADVVAGRSPDNLLDTYGAERRPVAARVLHNTLAQVALTTGGSRHDALRASVADLLTFDEARTHVIAMLTGLDIQYDTGAERHVHPLVGRRMPDVTLTTADGAVRLFELLQDAQPLHLRFGDTPAAPPPDPMDRARTVDAAGPEVIDLPVLGTVDMPNAVLVRPDGHVAWTDTPTDADARSGGPIDDNDRYPTPPPT